jgi:hypothetical protein
MRVSLGQTLSISRDPLVVDWYKDPGEEEKGSDICSLSYSNSFSPTLTLYQYAVLSITMPSNQRQTPSTPVATPCLQSSTGANNNGKDRDDWQVCGQSIERRSSTDETEFECQLK